jgi:hypothetical protein
MAESLGSFLQTGGTFFSKPSPREVAERADISLVGQCLLQNDHLESMDAFTFVNSSLIRRSVYAKFRLHFS